jgi:uncharacterized membrane protein
MPHTSPGIRNTQMNRKTNKVKPDPNLSPDHQDQLGMERLVFFSDAVFAIAITLIVLEIRLPITDGSISDAQMFPILVGMWHKFLAYVISFLVVGIFWMGHHRKFRYIKRYDSTLLFLNLLMLMGIAFLPFPSSIISEYPYRIVTIFYAFVLMLSSIFSVIIWWYASRNNRLIDPNLDQKQRRRQFINPFATALIFLLSIGVAFIDVNLARFCWLLIFPVSIYVNRI